MKLEHDADTFYIDYIDWWICGKKRIELIYK